MIKIVCTNCAKPLSLDETKLPPNKEVVFPCPVCKTKLTVDRRNLEAGAPEAAAPAAAPAHDSHHEGHADDEDGFGSKARSEEHTSELQSRQYLVCRLLLEKKKGPLVAYLEAFRLLLSHFVHNCIF